MEITLNLTQQQIDFLKEFAMNHYPDAPDNLLTDRPLHCVQTKTVEYVPAADCGDYNVYVNIDDEDQKFIQPEFVVLEYGEYNDETEIIDYETALDDGIGGEPICDVSDYFRKYNVPDTIRTYSALERYKDVAFFFTRKNAQKYMQVQAHNLTKPRVFSVHRGYANDSDYEFMHFYDLLLSIGTQLNSVIVKNDEIKYAMLKRLCDDCDNYIKQEYKNTSSLWMSDVKSHIDKMEEIYLSTSIKPKWISLSQINDYHIIMTTDIRAQKLADSIEQYFFERGEYDIPYHDRLKCLSDDHGCKLNRTDAMHKICKMIIINTNFLLNYFDNELSVLSENDELREKAMLLKKHLSNLNKQGD